MHEFRKLFRLTGGFRRFFLLLLLRSPFDSVNTVLLSVFLHFAFDAIDNQQPDKLYFTCLLYGIGSLLLFVYNGTVWTFYATFVTKWSAILRKKLFDHIAGLSLQKVEEKPSGDWITRLNADVYSAAAVISQPLHLPHAVCAGVNILISSTVLFCMSPKVYGLVLLFVLPQVVISQLIAKPMPELYRKSLEDTAKNTTDMCKLKP